jgi:intein/homing endonuclease
VAIASRIVKEEYRQRHRQFRDAARISPNIFIEFALGWDHQDFHREWQDGMDKYDRLLILSPKDHGKCIRSDCYCLTSGGLVRANVLRGFSAISLGEDFNLREHRASANSNGKVKCFRVRTTRGFEVDVSDNHPFLIRSGSRRMKWQSRMEPGGPEPNDSGYIWEETGVYSWAAIRDGLSEGDLVGIVNNHRALGARKRASSDANKVGRFLGYMVGDGCCGSCTFTNSEEEVLQDFDYVSKELGFGTRFRYSSDRNSVIISLSNGIRNFLKEYNLLGKLSKEKQLPRFILGGSDQTVLNFLETYINCDGYFRYYKKKKGTDRHFELATASEELGRQIQLLLLRFGIRASRYEKKIGKFTAWIIRVFGEEAQVLLGLNYLGKREQQKQKYISSLEERRWIPKIFDTRGDIFLDRITGIRDIGYCKTTDVEVPGPENFVVNGFITHNTSQISVARTIYDLGRDPNLRFKIITNSDDKSTDILTEISENIRENDRVQEVFPKLRIPPGAFDNKHKLTVERTRIMKDSSIEAIGIMTTGSGGRTDRLVGDDVCDFRNAILEPATREVVKQKWDGEFIGSLEPDGRVRYICVLPNTMVTTEKGSKEIQDIKVGEKVLTFGGNFREVGQVFENGYKGEIIGIKVFHGGEEVWLTPNHKIPVKRKGGIKKIAADKLRIGDTLGYPQYTRQTEKLEAFQEFWEDIDFWYFCGMWVAEGSIVKKKGYVHFSFGTKDWEDGIGERIESFIRTKLDRSPWKEKRGGDRSSDKALTFGYKELSQFLAVEFGTKAYGKRLPVWLWGLDRDCLLSFLEGLFDGDGTVQKNQIMLTTVSRQLAVDLHELLMMRLGISSGISSIQRDRIIIQGRSVKARPTYYIQSSQLKRFIYGNGTLRTRGGEIENNYGLFRNPMIWKKIRQIERRDYEGKVYNLNVLGGDSTYSLSGNFSVRNCTPWHGRDLTQKLKKLKIYTVCEHRIGEHFEPLWPTKWGVKYLMHRFDELGVEEFDRQFRNKVVSEGARAISSVAIGRLQHYEMDEMAVDRVILGVDPGMMRDTNSRSSLFVLGMKDSDKGSVKIPLEIREGDYTAPELVNQIKDLYFIYLPDTIKVESNAFQLALAQWLEADLEIAAKIDACFTSGRRKYDQVTGVKGMGLSMERGEWILPLKGHPEKVCQCTKCSWVRQLEEFPYGDRDDMVMSSWIAVSGELVGRPKIRVLG